MYVVATGTLYSTLVNAHAVVKTAGAMWLAKILVGTQQSGIAHGDGVVITQIGVQMLDGNIMRHPAIVTLATTDGVVLIVNAHVHSPVFFEIEVARFEDHHVYSHGSVVTGQAQ